MESEFSGSQRGVEKSIWSKAGDKLPMMVKLHNQEGFAFGHGKSLFPEYKWNTNQKWPWFDIEKTFYLNMPSHHWLSQRIFSFSRTSANAGFYVLSEGKWTVSTNADWLHLSVAGGEATNENEFQVVFYADENTTGDFRNASIEFVTNIDGREEKRRETNYPNYTVSDINPNSERFPQAFTAEGNFFVCKFIRRAV